MPYVICELSTGLRDSEVTVVVQDLRGGRVFLRVEKDFVQKLGGKNCLPVGLIQSDNQHALIELPHEADSGVNRLWVQKDQLCAIEEAIA